MGKTLGHISILVGIVILVGCAAPQVEQPHGSPPYPQGPLPGPQKPVIAVIPQSYPNAVASANRLAAAIRESLSGDAAVAVVAASVTDPITARLPTPVSLPIFTDNNNARKILQSSLPPECNVIVIAVAGTDNSGIIVYEFSLYRRADFKFGGRTSLLRGTNDPIGGVGRIFSDRIRDQSKSLLSGG